MDSKSLEQHGFKRWYPWDKLTISGMPFKERGIYAIKSKTPLARKVGKSDILYIGSSGNLLERIFKNYLFGVGGKTTQRIHKFLFEDEYLGQTEMGWATAENFEELEKYLEGIKWHVDKAHERLEKRLKLKFETEHGELPPWNERL